VREKEEGESSSSLMASILRERERERGRREEGESSSPLMAGRERALHRLWLHFERGLSVLPWFLPGYILNPMGGDGNGK